ncbi:hypothetical protein ACTXT7_004910 [Hymenolepis weldensis]
MSEGIPMGTIANEIKESPTLNFAQTSKTISTEKADLTTLNPKVIPSIRLNESYGITPPILIATSTTRILEAITPPKEEVLMEQKYEDVMQQFLQMPLLLVMICAIFVFLLLIIGWISSLVLLNVYPGENL